MHAAWFLTLLFSQVLHPLPVAAGILSYRFRAHRRWSALAGAGLLLVVHLGFALAWNDLAACLHPTLWVTSTLGALGIVAGVQLVAPVVVSCIREPTLPRGLVVGGGVLLYGLLAAVGWVVHMLSVDCGI